MLRFSNDNPCLPEWTLSTAMCSYTSWKPENFIIHKFYVCVYLIISDVVYIISGISKGGVLNTLQSYDMTMHKWTTLQPMKEKRDSHAVCIQGDRIIVAGGDNALNQLDTSNRMINSASPFRILYEIHNGSVSCARQTEMSGMLAQ